MQSVIINNDKVEASYGISAAARAFPYSPKSCLRVEPSSNERRSG